MTYHDKEVAKYKLKRSRRGMLKLCRALRRFGRAMKGSRCACKIIERLEWQLRQQTNGL